LKSNQHVRKDLVIGFCPGGLRFGLFCFTFSISFSSFHSPVVLHEENMQLYKVERKEMLFSLTFQFFVGVLNVVGAKQHKYCYQSYIQTSISWRSRRSLGRNKFTNMLFMLSFPKISLRYIP